MGCPPECAAAQSFEAVHGPAVAAGDQRALAAAHLLAYGRARTSHLGQAAAGKGSGSPSTGAKAASPSASMVWRTRRASLRATAKVARLPPWRALTCW